MRNVVIIPRGNIIPSVFSSNQAGIQPYPVLSTPAKEFYVSIDNKYFFGSLDAAKQYLTTDGHFRGFIEAKSLPLISIGAKYQGDTLVHEGTYYKYTGSTTTFEPDKLEALPSLGTYPDDGFFGGYSSEALYLNNKDIRVIARGSKLIWQERTPGNVYKDILGV